MRVALVCERFAPGGGGVESVVTELARELARRGHDVTVVCHTSRAEPPAGVALRILRVPRFWQPLRVLAFSRAAARAGTDYELVHGFARTRHQHVYRAGGGSHAAYLERVSEHPRLERALSPRHRVILSIEEAVLRDPAQIIQCNSRLVAAELARRYDLPAERSTVIYNGVDLERFHPRRREREGAALRAELALGGPVALFVGHGFARKGLDRALEGLARAKAPATLLVAGRDDPAPYRTRAEALGLASRVVFLGARADVEALLAAADLFVLPTRYDAFANVCLEALAAGVPVATTRANGACELIEPDVNGFLCDDDFAPAFAALEEPESLAALGRAARTTAEAYSWSRHADEVVALYERVLA